MNRSCTESEAYLLKIGVQRQQEIENRNQEIENEKAEKYKYFNESVVAQKDKVSQNSHLFGQITT